MYLPVVIFQGYVTLRNGNKLKDTTTKGQLEELIPAKPFCHLRLLHDSQTAESIKTNV